MSDINFTISQDPINLTISQDPINLVIESVGGPVGDPGTAIAVSPTPPLLPSLNALWVDTSV